MSGKTKTDAQKQAERFVETARELGLDNEESAAAFERVFGKIAPPKKRGNAPSNDEKKSPSKDD
jgi:hypothetical protein